MARMDKVKVGLASFVRGLPAADLKLGESPSEVAAAEAAPMIPRRGSVVIAVLVAVVAAIVIGVQVQKQREHDRLVDQYFCTLSDVSLFDRAPNSGDRCIDVLGY